AGPTRPAAPRAHLIVIPASRLPRFSDVGGNDALKEELRTTVGLLLQHPDDAERYRITWNGLLLHGPAGSGKSFLVKALAGEFGLNLVAVSTADLLSGTRAGASMVVDAFDFALHHLPCVLFFDEVDAVAQTRGQTVEPGRREVVTQLLESVEANRDEPRLVVAAATNDVDALDPAFTRPGRFDRIVRLALPDTQTREAILQVALDGRPCDRLDLGDCARRTRGLTPAGLTHAVEGAALAAFREAIGTGKTVRISNQHLLHAIERSGGTDRPLVEDWNWSKLVVPDHIAAELHQLQMLLEDPDEAARYGVDPPAGVLLAGPPGTGKTTIAKVLAAEAAC